MRGSTYLVPISAPVVLEAVRIRNGILTQIIENLTNKNFFNKCSLILTEIQLHLLDLKAEYA